MLTVDNLKVLADRHNLPWAVMGDFNDVVYGEEKWGGNGVCRRRVEEYTGYMNYCNLIDLGFTGLKFTWTNKRDLPGLNLPKVDWIGFGRMRTGSIAFLKLMSST